MRLLYEPRDRIPVEPRDLFLTTLYTRWNLGNCINFRTIYKKSQTEFILWFLQEKSSEVFAAPTNVCKMMTQTCRNILQFTNVLWSYNATNTSELFSCKNQCKYKVSEQQAKVSQVFWATELEWMNEINQLNESSNKYRVISDECFITGPLPWSLHNLPRMLSKMTK